MMKFKSFIFMLGFALISTCTYAQQGKIVKSTLETAFCKKTPLPKVGVVGLSGIPLKPYIPTGKTSSTLLTQKIVPTPLQLSLKQTISATLMSRTEYLSHGVWKLENKLGQVIAYAKVSTTDEVARTEMIKNIVDGDTVQKGGLRPRYKNIEIEYPQIITNHFRDLPKILQCEISVELKTAKKFEDTTPSPHQGFVLSPVDTSGVNLKDFQNKERMYHALKSRSYLLQQLNYQPISQAEWQEVENLIQTLNEVGFYHNDLQRNLFLKRNPITRKLKVTLIDFEPIENGMADMEVVNSWKKTLQQYGLFTENPVSQQTVNQIRTEEKDREYKQQQEMDKRMKELINSFTQQL